MRSVAVTIAGKRISLKSDADEGYVQLLAEHVDGKMRELMGRSRQAGGHDVAVLAALQIADDLFRERRKRTALRARVRQRAQRILDSIEERNSKT